MHGNDSQVPVSQLDLPRRITMQSTGGCRYQPKTIFLACTGSQRLRNNYVFSGPSAIIISMAAVESAYGKSRFAMEGNALFGVRTWSAEVPQMKPLGLPDAEFGVKKYKTKCESVKDMIRIINNHPAYEKFRQERIIQQKDGKWDYGKLMDGLTAWSTNEQYKTLILKKIKMLNLP